MGWFDGASDVGSTTSHRTRKSSSSKHHHHSSREKRSSPRASGASLFGLGVPEPSSSHRSHSRSRSAHGDPRGSSASFFNPFGIEEPTKHDREKHEREKHEREKHDKEKERSRGLGSIFGGGSEGKHSASRSSFFGGFGSGRSSSYYKRSPRQGYLKRIYAKLRRLLRDLIYYMKKNPMKVFMLVIMPLITGGALTTLLAKFGLRLPAGLQKLFGGANGGRGGGGYEYSRTKVEGPLGAMGGLGGVANMVGGMGGIGSAMSLAKMFM